MHDDTDTTPTLTSESTEVGDFERWRKLAMPLAASLAIHALLLTATVFIAWRVVHFDAGREVFVRFDEPSLGGAPVESNDTVTGAPTATGTSGETAPRPAESGDIADAPTLATTSGTRLGRLDPEIEAPVLRDMTGAPDPIPGGEDLFVDATPARGDVRFAGLGSGNARSIVYVVDASGPMVTSLRIVRRELIRSIDRLAPTQRFGVVVFRRLADLDPDSKGIESFAPVLVRATPGTKQRLAEWLQTIEPRGRSAPLDGLRVAIRLNPDAIFLLSRSIERSGGGVWDLGYDKTMDELDKLNPEKRSGPRAITIRTIQFLSEDPTGIMQAIGRTHGGGGYTVITTPDALPAQ